MKTRNTLSSKLRVSDRYKTMKKGSHAALKTATALAHGIALSMIVFFTYILLLRTNYKNTALEINDAILTNRNVTISCGDDTCPASHEVVEYYNKFLLFRNTVVFSKKTVPVTSESIVLGIGDNELSFTGLEDGSAIAIKWKTAEDDKNYIVRSQMTFMQLKAYYNNYKRKLE